MDNLFDREILGMIKLVLVGIALAGYSGSLMLHFVLEGEYVTFSKMILQYPLCVLTRVCLMNAILVTLVVNLLFQRKDSLPKVLFLATCAVISSSLLLMSSGDGEINWNLHSSLIRWGMGLFEVNEMLMLALRDWPLPTRGAALFAFLAVQLIPIWIDFNYYRTLEVFLIFGFIFRIYFSVMADPGNIRLAPASEEPEHELERFKLREPEE
jgi:hypothetical protein